MLLLDTFVAWSDRVRADRVAQILRPHIHGRTLDVGCWNGEVASRLGDAVVGLDVVQPPKPRIPVTLFDGRTIPYPDRAFDTVLCCTALHHADDQDALLAEMLRVGRRIVILEDSFDSTAERISVTLLHAIGSRLVSLPYRRDGFRTSSEWCNLFERHGLRVAHCERHPGVQPGWLFLRHPLFVLESP